MRDRNVVISSRESSLLATHKVLRRTYFMLSLTLLFSAACAWLSFTTGTRGPGLLLTFVGAYGFLMLTQFLRNSVWGIASCFAFTGFMGYILGPTLNMFIHGMSNGGEIVSMTIGATGAIFLALSAYALLTRKDFSYLSGFLFAGMVVLLLAMIGLIVFQLPMLQLAISCGFVLFSSGMILFETSNIIHGGERNFIMATVSLYVSIYNLFVSLLQIFAALSGRD